MSKDLFIQDVAKVTFRSIKTNNVVGVGYAQAAGFEVTAEQTEVRGGIGNPVAYVIKNSKSITLNVTSATFKPEFIALTQGAIYEDNKTANVMDSFFTKVLTDGGAPEELTIEIPTDLTALNLTQVRVEDKKGKQMDLAVQGGEVVIPSTLDLAAGDDVEVYYIKQITGRKIEFRADSYSEKVRVEYQVPCYDRETETIVSDLYFIFHEASPSSNFSLTLQAGEALTPELSFIVTAPKGSSVLGEKYEIPRA